MKDGKNDLVFGIHAVNACIDSGAEIDKLFIVKSTTNPELVALRDKCKSLKIPVKAVPPEKLDRITRKNHQGVLCFRSPVTFKSLDHVIDDCFARGEDPFILILDHITDVRNFGAIVRSAACAGVHAVLIPATGGAPVNEDAYKTASGGFEEVALCRTTYLRSDIKYLNDSGITTIAATEKTDKSIYDLKIEGPVALVVGNEEYGVSDEILSTCMHNCQIPMRSSIGSLNVSVAAGVMMFELLRQKMAL